VTKTGSVWEAYLLFSLWHSLPLFWHSLYCQRTYTYDEKDIEDIKCFLHDDDNSWARANARRLFIAPQVIKAPNKYFVQCCYWSSFGGYIRETVEVILNDGKASFKAIDEETLYKYNCGVRF